jgi:hypothetical protein
MTWLERVRLKNLPPTTLDSDKSAKSYNEALKNLSPYESGSDKSVKRHDEESSGTFVTTEVVGHEVFMGPVQVIIVAYQRFSLDYDLPDGTYTPKQLRQAELLVKPGLVLRYRLLWPGGATHPSQQQTHPPSAQVRIRSRGMRSGRVKTAVESL